MRISLTTWFPTPNGGRRVAGLSSRHIEDVDALGRRVLAQHERALAERAADRLEALRADGVRLWSVEPASRPGCWRLGFADGSGVLVHGGRPDDLASAGDILRAGGVIAQVPLEGTLPLSVLLVGTHVSARVQVVCLADAQVPALRR